MRIVDWDLHVHLKHEFLVFSLSYNGEESFLYFEHWWGGESEVPVAHDSAKELDELMFYKRGDSEENGRREWTTSVLEVNIDATCADTRSTFTLASLAKILRKYQNDHPMYRLFGANCWAWSRAIILDIIKPPLRVERVMMVGKDLDITPEQLKIYLMTEYGAWGSLLLRFVDFEDEGRVGLPTARYYTMRAVLAIYGVADWAIWFKRIILGSLNWTIRLRTFSVTNERSVSLGLDYTHVALPSDLTDLVPAIPGSSSLALVHTFCQPGRYMYLLTAPIFTAHSRIMSVHIFAFGSIAGSEVGRADNIDTESVVWLECAILRRIGTSVVEVSDPGRLPLDLHSRAKTEKRTPYGAVHVLDFSHPLTQALRGGDRIGVWARGYAGLVHEPSSAMVKVTTRHPIGIIDVILALDTAAAIFRLGTTLFWDTPDPGVFPTRWLLNVILRTGNLFLRLFAYLPWWLIKRCDMWVWSNISRIARQLLE